jgi:hypothetical protein
MSIIDPAIISGYIGSLPELEPIMSASNLVAGYAPRKCNQPELSYERVISVVHPEHWQHIIPIFSMNRCVDGSYKFISGSLEK